MAYDIVFTNGCFDILHRGHVELLKYCSKIGNRVIVGINSDDSVKRLKGSSRPIFKEGDRKMILESIRFVDSVLIFDEDTPYELIKTLKPDIIVKGGDHDRESVVGSDICEVSIFDYIDGYSTTKTISDNGNR